MHAAHTHLGESFPRAICLLTPFVSAASVRLAHGPLSLRVSGAWAPVDVFRMKRSALEQGHPLFVAHGEDDEVIHHSHGKAIADYAGRHGVARFVLVPGATHASIRSDRARAVYPAFAAFLEGL